MGDRKHYAAAISAFIIWGFFSIPLRALSNYSAGEILYFRILFSLLVLCLIIFAFRKKEVVTDWRYFQTRTAREKRTTVLLTLAGGALLCINWLTFIYIVNNINVKTASFSYLICPVMTAALGYFLIKETMTKNQWIALALCAVSCLLIGMSSALELGYSILTALTYAIYLITQRKNQGFDRMNILGVQVLFSFIILSFVYELLVTSVPSQLHFYIIITVIAGVFTVLPLFLNLFALNRINSATIGILMYLNPVLNFSVAFFVFNENVTVLQLTGYLILLIALILFNVQNFRKLQVAFNGRQRRTA